MIKRMDYVETIGNLMDSEVAEILRLCRALSDDDWVQVF